MEDQVQVTNTSHPEVIVDTALEWTQLAINCCIPKRSTELNRALVEAVNQLRLARSLLNQLRQSDR